MSEYSVESFIEGEMREGKSGTLKELVDNAHKEREAKKALEEQFPNIFKS